MHRPLETTFWMRFSRFVKGIFLYNTIYWKRASDDLDIRRMSREERAQLRPTRDLNIIRPREKPRPASEQPVVLHGAIVSEPLESDPPAEEVRPIAPPLAPASARPVVPPVEDGMEIRRRKKRRKGRHSQVMPSAYYEPGREGGGMFGWLFKK